MNPTITLAQIRAAGPCAEGWTKLLAGLGYTGGKHDPARVVSLGDVAAINDADDALWCIRFLDWSDIAVRRAVIAGAVLPAVRRAALHTTDRRVHDGCVAPLAAWCAGDGRVDLVGAAEAAEAALAALAAVAAEAARAALEAERDQQRADIIAAFPRL